ncbi:unnamed protein product [Lymnaea stagnalis]|uniref:Uncharacterized protein n=1 Tax=Lymnaea stagnalis TaxID=6523 RepID=A0AAV2I698_LYMST
MSIYLHGVDYVQMTVDFSFKKLSQKVTELLTRTRKLDALFLNCLDKFDDPDKYAIPLPDLIDRMLTKERSQSHINNADKKLVQKLSEERDLAKRQVRRLEDELDKVLQRQSPTQKPQEIQLRNRQNINVRYSLLLPDHAHHSDLTQPGAGPFTVTTLNPANSVDNGSNPHQSSSQPDSHKNSGPPLVNYGMGSQVVAPDPRLVVKNNDTDGRPPDAGGMANTSVDAKKTSSQYSINPTDSKTNYVLHYPTDSKTNYVLHYPTDSKTNYVLHYPTDSKTNYVLHSASSFHAALPQGKLRRHASEESLKVAISKEEAETSSLTYLNHAMNQGQRTTQNATVEGNPPHQNNITKQPPSTRVDVQNKMLRMLTSASKTNQKVRRSESERAVGSHGPRVDRPWKNAEADSIFKGNTSLRASYENIVSAVKKGEQLLDGSSPPNSNTNSFQYQHNEEPPHNPYRIIFQQPASHKPPGRQAGSHQSRQEHYQLQKQRQASSLVYEDPVQEQSLHTKQASTTQKTTLIYPRDPSLPQSKTEEWQPAVGHARTSSRDRDSGLTSHTTSFLPRPPSRGNPSAVLDYTSDSEMVINSGTRTASPGRTKARVRFASPVSRSSKPNKKAHGRGILANYQNDTASATNKRIKKRI